VNNIIGKTNKTTLTYYDELLKESFTFPGDDKFSIYRQKNIDIHRQKLKVAIC